jgi:hypothetical protein
VPSIKVLYQMVLLFMSRVHILSTLSTLYKHRAGGLVHDVFLGGRLSRISARISPSSCQLPVCDTIGIMDLRGRNKS